MDEIIHINKKSPQKVLEEILTDLKDGKFYIEDIEDGVKKLSAAVAGHNLEDNYAN